MAVLNFPSNPTLNQVYSFNGKTWIWNGQGWALDKKGAINGVIIGNVIPASGAFTTLSVIDIVTDTVAANTITSNSLNVAGVINSSSLTTTGNVVAGNVIASSVIGNIQANGVNGAVQFNLNGKISGVSGFEYNQTTGDLFVKTLRGTGDPVSGTGAIYGGIAGYVNLGSTVLGQFTANTASYAQINAQNINTGNLASADYVITSDNGTDTTYYLDLGLAGSNHADPNFFGDTSSKNDAYLYVTAQDQAGPFTDTGNLIIGSTNGVIKLFVGNTAQANVVATVSSNGISVDGNVVIDGNLTVTGNATISGNIIGDRIQNGNTSIDIQTVGGNANISVSGVSNVAVFTPDGLDVDGAVSVTGNVTGNYFVGNGAFLTGITSYSDANVVTLLADFGSNVISTTGNITSSYFIGNGAFLTGLPQSYSNANVAAYLPTYTGNLVSLGGDVITTANVRGGNVTTSGQVSATGNVSGGNVRTAGVVSATGTVTGGNLATAGTASATGNITGGNLTTAGAVSAAGTATAGNIATSGTVSAAGTATVGNLATSGTVSATGTVTGGNLVTSGTSSAAGNITGGNILTSGLVSAAGTVTGSSLLGGVLSVSGNITGGNVLYGAGIVSGTGNIYGGNLFVSSIESVTGNIQGGNLLTGGLVSAGGTITGGNLATDGTANVTGNVTGGNLLTAGLVSATGTITSAANITGGNLTTAGRVSATGNVIGGNLTTAGLISATGTITSAANVSGGNLTTTGQVSATANVIGGNVLTSGQVSATANVSGGNLTTAGQVSATANVIGGNLTTAGQVSATANIAGGNLTTAGQVSATGNVTGGNVLTSGQTSATGNVTGGNLLTAGLISATGTITSAANIAGANLTTAGQLSAAANVTGGNLLTAGLISATSTITSAANITGGNLTTAGQVSATANVTGGNVLTSGQVSAAGTITGTSLLGSFVSVSANITGGNILTGGAVSATGNLTGGNVNTNKVAGTGLTLTSTGNLNIQPTGNVVLNATYINDLADPQQPQDAATKLYVDNMITTGLSFHQPVYVATTGTLETATGGIITYSQPNGAANGVGAKLTTTGSFNLIDTANIQTVGTRILVKNQANAVLNGVYGWANSTTIVRTTDADQYGTASDEQISLNDYFFVQSGNVNGGSAYVVTAPSGVITFGTSNIVFAQFSQTQPYNANTAAGLSLIGTVFNAKVDDDTTAFDGNGNISVKPGANLVTPNIGDATGTSLSVTGNVDSGNLRISGTVSATGNIAGGNLSGTNITGTITTANQPYITSVGSLTSLSVVGNVAGGNITTAGQLSAYSNVTGGNLVTSGTATVTGTITGGEFVTGGDVSAAGNITGGGILTSGLVSASGNVTGNYILGNGALLTGIITTVSNISNGTSNINVVSSGGNITASVGGVSNVVVWTPTGEYVTGVVSATGNVTGNYILGNGSQLTGILGNNVNMGSNTTGQLVSNALTLTTSTTVTNGIALLNQVLGKLVPPAPPSFPNATALALSGIASYRMANITQVDNTPDLNKSVPPGTTVANVLRVATYSTNTIANVGPGDSGTIVAVRNGANVGSVTLNAGASPSGNGTYGSNLVISNNYDYHSANSSITAGFWYVFSAAVSGSAAPGGWNELYIADTAAANTNATIWYYDNASPSAPSFSSTTMTPPGSANLLYSSTIPHYTNNNNFTIAFNVANISGNTYPTANTLASGTAGGAFAAPVTINYNSSNIGSNILPSFASASANTTASIITGFGGSSTGPSMSVNNSYSTGTLTLTTALANTVLYKSGTSTAIDESNVVIGSTIGSGSGNAYRIVNPGTGNTPVFTGTEAQFNSQTSTLQTYDATVVGSGSQGVLKHDQTNYSTGYLPAGPNLSSGRSGTQYFTMKFVRTATSKFDINFTGNVAGVWVALPGSVIDSSSGANGWMNMATAYAGAGYPGVNSPGNGSDGCAVGGTITLNSSGTQRKTCTFGTVSSSSTATNEIYVRIALTAGQSVTALTLETPTN